MSDEICQHCTIMESRGISHTKSCRCTHHHNRHNFAGGCTEPDCKCDRYDQSERAVRELVEKISVETFIETPVDPLVAEVIVARQTVHGDLIAAQSRVDALRKLASTISSTAEQSPD